MNKHSVIPIVIMLILFHAYAFAQRSKVVEKAYYVASLAADAATYSKRACKSTSLYELHVYVSKAKSVAEKAGTSALDAALWADKYGCGHAAMFLRDVEIHANETASLCKKALKADTFDDAEHYARKAKNVAETAEAAATSAAFQCRDE